ncbi:MAG: SUMF1/EgtB/PvdO family nonheme iron enzyme [Chloroflexi bacterium]|uniref:SUMF1/EgtB/PvdO family nonheme iron enzyme n=1 Tax=Candidatus Chlorohelix allophototropha TaxID=3003348 RepID=A0A8T7MAN0_9CHLR|nr:SUMF1/EgtB/PvdO family nonheme iron enzyme [Chloroflexota bacterium]WJW68694.1 SUMF1/EgtB/PvdO family nonheme iron enzyme [Chloroflexota bacterium L227-S17]
MPDPAKLKVFLCHSHKDKHRVYELYQQLQNEGWIQPWLDKEDLTPGDNWELEIPKEVRQSHIVIVCLSPNATDAAGYVHKEIKLALDVADQQPEGAIFLVPLKLEECRVPERLGHLHWVDYFEAGSYARLLKSFKKRAGQVGVSISSVAASHVEKPSVATPKPAPVAPPVRKEAEPKPTPAPTKTEAERLLDEIAAPNTTHQRRMAIGDRLSEIGDPRRGVGLRKDGLPDIAWLAVSPGGRLEVAKQTFEVQPFYIAQYQVTFAQYEAFVQAKDGYQNREWWQGFPKEYQPQALKGQKQMRLNNPRDNVSWYQSVAFGRWLNRYMRGLQLPNPGGGGNQLIVGNNAQVRLPLEREWQWAAQGGAEQRKYPWGVWQESCANTSEAGLKRTTAVGMYPQGAAKCGAMDMSGNLWEWCQNKWEKPDEVAVDESRNSRVLRGGSCYGDQVGAACMFRYGYGLPLDGYFDCGFRLVVSSPIAGL